MAALGSGSLACLLGVIAGALPPGERSFRFPDGSEVTLEGATYGRTRFHLLEAGGLKERFLRLLPGWLLEELGLAAASLECDDEGALVFWLGGRGAEQRANEWDLTVRDEHGCELPVGASVQFRHTASGSWLASATLKVWPRHGRRLALVIRDRRYLWPPSQRAASLLGELQAANPAPRTPLLEAEPLPAVRRVGELEMTFREFESGLADADDGPLRPAGPGDLWWCRLRFDLASIDRADRGWKMQGFEILDGQGNIIPMRRSMQRVGEISVDAGPCVEEPWRLRCAVVPTEVDSLAADEVLSFEGIQPHAAGPLLMHRQGTLQGAIAELVSVEMKPSLSGARRLSIQAQVTGSFSPPAPVLMCRVRGDGLNELVSGWDRRSQSGETTLYTFELDELPRTARKLDVTLILPRVRVVEAIVRPVRASHR